MDVNVLLQSIGDALRPDSLGDIFTYAVFFLALLTLIFMPDGNERPTYLLFGTIFLAIFDLFRTGIPVPFDRALVADTGFVTFFTHMLMFILPAIATGLTRTRKKQGGMARILGLTTTLVAVLYTVLSFIDPVLFYQTPLSNFF